MDALQEARASEATRLIRARLRRTPCPQRCERWVGSVPLAQRAEVEALEYAAIKMNQLSPGRRDTDIAAVTWEHIEALLAAAHEDGFKAATRGAT